VTLRYNICIYVQILFQLDNFSERRYDDALYIYLLSYHSLTSAMLMLVHATSRLTLTACGPDKDVGMCWLLGATSRRQSAPVISRTTRGHGIIPGR